MQATVIVNGEHITGEVYHVRDNGWPCVETESGRIASGPSARPRRRKCTGSGIARELTRGMPGLPWMRKCPTCERYLDENGGNRLPTHYVVTAQ